MTKVDTMIERLLLNQFPHWAGQPHSRLCLRNPDGPEAITLLQSQQAEIARLSAMVEEKDAALRAVERCMLHGGDGQVGDYGWRISELNKARPLIRQAISTEDK